ncbi:MAG: hypothetical protein AAF547_02975 [Actinomycetota bacterium]
METTGEQRRRSICEEVGDHLDCSTAVKSLCLGWVVSGIALTWAGFGAIGLRSVDTAAQLRTLERIQAIAVLLTIFTIVVGAIWSLRVDHALPNHQTPGRTGWRRRAVHAGAAAVAGLVLPAASMTGGGSVLLPVLAWSGFIAALVVLRPLHRAPVTRPSTVTALAAAVLFQMTVGWLHLLDPGGPLAPTLIVQGLVLAWTATAAAREIGTIQQLVRRGVPAPELSREPVRPPLPEPAVGH